MGRKRKKTIASKPPTFSDLKSEKQAGVHSAPLASAKPVQRVSAVFSRGLWDCSYWVPTDNGMRDRSRIPSCSA